MINNTKTNNTTWYSKINFILIISCWLIAFFIYKHIHDIEKPYKIKYRDYLGKEIIIKGPFSLNYKRPIGKSPSILLFYTDSLPLPFNASCIGIENQKFCGKKNYKQKFSNTYEIEFFIENVSDKSFSGFIISIKEVNTNKFLLKNNHSIGEYIFRRKIYKLIIMISILIVPIYIFKK